MSSEPDAFVVIEYRGETYQLKTGDTLHIWYDIDVTSDGDESVTGSIKVKDSLMIVGING